jgi:hypothetical protein
MRQTDREQRHSDRRNEWTSPTWGCEPEAPVVTVIFTVMSTPSARFTLFPERGRIPEGSDPSLTDTDALGPRPARWASGSVRCQGEGHDSLHCVESRR